MSLYVIAGGIFACISIITVMVMSKLSTEQIGPDEWAAVVFTILLMSVIWPIPSAFLVMYGIASLIAKLIETIG